MSGHPPPLASSPWPNLVHLDYASLYAYWPWLELRSRPLDLWSPPPATGCSSAPDRPKLSFGIDVILSDRLGSSCIGPESTPNQSLWMPTESGDSTREAGQSQDQAEQHFGGSSGSNSNGSSGSNSNGNRKRSWSRAVFSNLQRKGLEKRFQLQKYITKPDRRQLAATLGLTDAQVKVWFQNRRMKWRHNREKDIPLASGEKRSASADSPKALPL